MKRINVIKAKLTWRYGKDRKSIVCSTML